MPAFKPKKYIKDESFDPIYTRINPSFAMRTRLMPGLLFAGGIFVLVWQVIMPLVFFKTMNEVSKPVSSSVLGVASGFRDFEFSELSNAHSGNVLGAKATPDADTLPKYLYLTIPKLNIKDAAIEINPATLSPDKALGHYPGSSFPGEVGNVFIYGHSVLPWFYNPKNYKTIFSTLGNLEAGDEFFLVYKNVKYRYKVEGKVVLSPETVDPLAEIKPKYLNESTAVLMTCSPPGTKLKRLLVNAVLIK